MCELFHFVFFVYGDGDTIFVCPQFHDVQHFITDFFYLVQVSIVGIYRYNETHTHTHTHFMCEHIFRIFYIPNYHFWFASSGSRVSQCTTRIVTNSDICIVQLIIIASMLVFMIRVGYLFTLKLYESPIIRTLCKGNLIP